MIKTGDIKFGFLLVFCIFIIKNTFGQKPKIEVSVSSKNVTINEVFQLQIKSNYDLQFTYPKLSDFQIGRGSKSFSSSVQIINNKITKEESYITTHRIKPTKEGTFTIGSFITKYNGKTYASNPIVIHVTNASKINSSISKNTNKNLFAEYITNKKEAYIGEAIYAYKKLYSRYGISDISQPTGGNIMGTVQTKNVGDATNVKTKREQINNTLYLTASFDKKIIFPMKKGEIELESFNTSISYGGFFGQVAEVKSSPRKIKIKPLPNNPPKDFTGGVGEYKISSQLNKEQIEIGDVVQLDIKIKGSGNIQLMLKPKIDIPKEFELYGDPVIEDKFKVSFQGMKGEIKYSYLLTAKQAGILKIPSVHFSYFNIKSKKYKSVISDSLSIFVKGDSIISLNTENIDIPINTKSVTTQLGQKLNFNQKISLNEIWNNLIWYKMIPIPLIIGLIFGFIIRKKEKNKSKNAIKNKRKNAKSNTKKLFLIAKDKLNKNQDLAFYEAIHMAIINYFSDKFSVEKSLLGKSKIEELLNNKKINTALKEEIINVIEQCEMAKFAAKYSTENEQFFEKTHSLINQLDSNL